MSRSPYQRVAGAAGGSWVRPVFHRESFTGAAQSKAGPGVSVAKSKSRYGRVLSPVQNGQPLFIALVVVCHSTYPMGPRSGLAVPASGP